MTLTSVFFSAVRYPLSAVGGPLSVSSVALIDRFGQAAKLKLDIDAGDLLDTQHDSRTCFCTKT